MMENNINIIIKDDENFLINILKDFYRKIIETKNFNNFEIISIEWIKNEILNNKKNSIKILKLMQNHKESNNWFTSLIGFFYQFGIGCNINKNKAKESYFLALNNETEKDFLNENFDKLHLIENVDTLKNENIIIGKYLLSLFYYKDIILDVEGFKYNQNKKNIKNDDQNEIIKLLKLAKNGDIKAQYNLAICYQNGNGIETNHKKAFKWLLNSVENGNLDAQYNLAIFYMDGIGVQKDEKEAFKWFLKSEQSSYYLDTEDEKENFEKYLKLAISNDSVAQNNLGNCYLSGKGIGKNETKAFGWYLKSANAGFAGYAEGQFNLGYCYENAIGTGKNVIKAFELYLRSAIAGNAKAQNS
ncbi:unnamed protein product [Rhizophagus irregularis]|nr:unnamed protein product [Rhizophagus irregularis]